MFSFLFVVVKWISSNCHSAKALMLFWIKLEKTMSTESNIFSFDILNNLIILYIHETTGKYLLLQVKFLVKRGFFHYWIFTGFEKFKPRGPCSHEGAVHTAWNYLSNTVWQISLIKSNKMTSAEVQVSITYIRRTIELAGHHKIIFVPSRYLILKESRSNFIFCLVDMKWKSKLLRRTPTDTCSFRSYGMILRLLWNDC